MSAPGLKLLLKGKEYEAWLAALHSLASGYYRATVALPPELPNSQNYRRVVAAVNRLENAVRGFGSGLYSQAPSIEFALAQVKWWAEGELEKRGLGGAPQIISPGMLLSAYSCSTGTGSAAGPHARQ